MQIARPGVGAADSQMRQRAASNLTVIKDAPHPFLGKQVWFDEMISISDEFFRTHLMETK